MVAPPNERATSPTTPSTTTSLHGYDIVVEPGLLVSRPAAAAARIAAAARAHRCVIITDDTVAALYAAPLAAALAATDPLVLRIPPGEQHKTRDRWGALTDAMLAAGCGRDTIVVALGGGVVGDLAGFVAATFMRGIAVVQVPTTLLAMIDASIGGKTGVDTPAGKNLVGAFHQPAAVLIDPLALRTLPIEQLRAGLAEAIKHGIIADAAYAERTQHALPAVLGEPGGDAMHALIADSVAIKTRVVAGDEREHGLRKILNFGHTLGHAIEAASGYRLLHGEAVAVGMVLESALAERLGIAVPGTAAAVRAMVERAGLPTACPTALEAEPLLALTRTDKKARAGRAEYALPRAIGAMAGSDSGWAVPVSDADVLALLRESVHPATAHTAR